MKARTHNVLPHCACQRCRAVAPAAVWQRDVSTQGVHESSAQRVASFECMPESDLDTDSQRPQIDLRSDGSASLCCKNDEDCARANPPHRYLPNGDEAAAAAH